MSKDQEATHMQFNPQLQPLGVTFAHESQDVTIFLNKTKLLSSEKYFPSINQNKSCFPTKILADT